MYPEITVIVPTYQRPDRLARALASVATACHRSHEIIVVDDCPEGSAAQVAFQFNAQYFCKAGQNRGLSRSRNLGIGLANGRYLVFLDDDDFFLPGGLDALHAALTGDATFAVGDFARQFPHERISTDLAPLTREHLLVCNEIPVGAYMIERSSIRRNFDELMRSHEDWDFLLSNIDWQRCRYTPFEVVTIDKTERLDASMQVRRKAHFWLDYLSVYARFPAPELAGLRKRLLAGLNIDVDENMLKHTDVI